MIDLMELRRQAQDAPLEPLHETVAKNANGD
jgi:hypothetical protein